jgi:hypothetical protein
MTDMTRAYDLAAKAVRRRLQEQRPEQLQALDEIRKGDVAVFKGTYDSAEQVLTRLGVPHTMDPKKLTASLVLANCSSTYSKVLLAGIEAHVRGGAWLVSTDHSLHHVVGAKFPGTARWDGKGGTGSEVVGVEPYVGSAWAEVVVPGVDPQWCLDGGSYPITIDDPDKVQIEAASHELLVRHSKPVIAVRFDWGDGHVFHVISHVWLKTTRAPGRAHQGPCVDFLRAGMRLSEEGIATVFDEVKFRSDELNFASIQSAVTATELVANLCVRATRPELAAIGL